MIRSRFAHPILVFVCGFLAFGIFAFCYSTPSTYIFDEHRYIAAARSLDGAQVNENWSHPVFAKWVMSKSLRIFGDSLSSARLPSVFAGAVISAMIFAISFLFTQSLALSVIAFALTIFNQGLFVQSRLANLDSAMTMWIFIALYFHFRWILKSEERSKGFFPAICWGLAIGCKWAAIPVATFWTLASCLLKRSAKTLAIVSVTIFLTYLASQLPLVGKWHPYYALPLSHSDSGQLYKIEDLFTLQIQMFGAQKDFRNNVSQYTSSWQEWPWKNRQVLYHYQLPDEQNSNTGSLIFFRLSTLLQWLGLLSILYCLYKIVKDKSQEASLILAAFLSLWISWAFIPRETQFLYYFLPAFLLYPIGIVYLCSRQKKPLLWAVPILFATILEFAYYFSILSGSPISTDEFNKWMPF